MAQWSTAVAIPNQTTKTSPALAYLNGTLHMLHLGSSSDNIWYSYYDRGQWTPNVQTGLRSRGPVAFVGPNTTGGNDFGLLVYRSFEQAPDGGYGFLHSLSRGYTDPWVPSGLLPGKPTSEHPPALTLDARGNWMLGSVIPGGRSMRVSRYAMTFGGTQPVAPLGSEVVANQSTKTTPALALYLGQMHLLHLGGGSNDIWHSIDFAPNVRVPDQASKATPAMAVYQNVLHMVHLGSGSESLWHTTYTPGRWTPNVRIPGQSSSAYPALAATPDGLHIVYKGADSGRIWHSIYR